MEATPKTFIGIATFGNLDFTKLTYRSIVETVRSPYQVCVIVGKPGDTQTAEWANHNNLAHIIHDQNYGFPYALNDLYDWGFIHHQFDNFISMGNDVIAYPETIDILIDQANTTEFEWVCSKQIDVRTLCSDYPQARPYFAGPNYIFTRFDARPWEYFDHPESTIIDAPGMSDTHNLSLFKRSIFEKIGYIDVNFYPAYFEDNDLYRRCWLTGIKSCTIDIYHFHFWSRTIKQGSGGSTNKFFELNRAFYRTKWGGDVTEEKYDIPFNGEEYALAGNIIFQPSLKIVSRALEKSVIHYWVRKGS